MSDLARAREPFFGEIPRVVLGLAGVISAVSALALVGPEPIASLIQATCILLVGFAPGEAPQPLGPYAPYALHVLVHGGWMHLILNMAGLVAFGTPVARRLRSPLLFIALFVATSVAGAAAEVIFNIPHHRTPMAGASSGVFGLVAAATYVRAAGLAGRLPGLGSRTLWAGVVPWIGINILFAFLPGAALGVPGQIAWIAHLGGLAAGVALFPLFDRLAGRA